MTAVDEAFTALAEPTRRAVVRTLAKGARSAGDLASVTGLSPAAMSRHLRVLRRHHLVEVGADDNDARVRLYSLQPGPLVQVRSWLDEVEGYWIDQLNGFASHVQGTQQ